LRLANLKPDEARQLAQVFDWMAWGVFAAPQEQPAPPPDDLPAATSGKKPDDQAR